MASGRVGATALTATTWATVYTVPAAKTAVCNITICNRNAATAKVRVGFGTGSSPSNGEYILYDYPLGATSLETQAKQFTGFVLEADMKVLAYSDTANVDVVVNALEQ